MREQFPLELKRYRSQSGHRKTWLIVATDADTGGAEDRMQGFRKACKDAGVQFRRKGERVMFVIPKRNIETWFAYLRGEPVNESDNYPRYAYEGDCRQDVIRLDEMCRRQRLEPPAPPSLDLACEELGRLSGL